MEVAHAVLLGNGSAGATSAWPAFEGPPFLTPVANRPMLVHVLEGLREAGILEASIAVDAREVAPVRQALRESGVAGIVAAVHASRADTPVGPTLASLLPRHDEDEPVLVARADTLAFSDLRRAIMDFAGARRDAEELRLRGDNRPAGWLLSGRAVPMVAGPVWSGTLLDHVHECGGDVGFSEVDGLLPCDGDQDELLESNRRLLRRLTARFDPGQLVDSQVQGEVDIHPTARLERSLVRGPAIIGPRTTLVDAYVGPYTSIGPDVRIEGSEIEHSIVMGGARISYVGARLETSVIGHGARIVRRFQLPAAVRVSVGSAAEVAL
jgi:glucose-1-phosphate thymidylyltransferase